MREPEPPLPGIFSFQVVCDALTSIKYDGAYGDLSIDYYMTPVLRVGTNLQNTHKLDTLPDRDTL